MADILVRNPWDNGVVQRYRDMGDGTFAPVSVANPDIYPPGSTPVRVGATAAAGATSATMPAVAGKTNYLTGFAVTGGGATAASIVTVTVTGLVGGTQTYKVAIPAGTTAGITPLIATFVPPLPASAANVAIAINLPSFGAGNTDAAVAAYGFVM